MTIELYIYKMENLINLKVKSLNNKRKILKLTISKK